MLHVKPKDGLVVIQPEISHVYAMPPEGAMVEDNNYYQRLLAAGDIELIPPKSTASKAPTEASHAELDAELTTKKSKT